MKDRSRTLGSVRCVRRRIIVGMLLLGAIRYGLIRPGRSNWAVAGTDVDKETLDTSASLQAAGRPATEEIEKPWREVWMRVTGYCPCRKCCGKYSDGITASGHKIGRCDEFAAADKKHLFGTRVIVPGYNNSKPVRVLDRGGAIHGNRLDLFFNSHRKAQEWGVRYLLVKVQVR